MPVFRAQRHRGIRAGIGEEHGLVRNEIITDRAGDPPQLDAIAGAVGDEGWRRRTGSGGIARQGDVIDAAMQHATSNGSDLPAPADRAVGGIEPGESCLPTIHDDGLAIAVLVRGAPLEGIGVRQSSLPSLRRTATAESETV